MATTEIDRDKIESKILFIVLLTIFNTQSHENNNAIINKFLRLDFGILR